MIRELKASVVAVVVLTVLLGLAYPLITTGAAQLLFPSAADGSRIERDGELVGSSLIGQDFSKRTPRRYFQSRPSATAYSADVTFFNNLGPNNRELRNMFRELAAAYLALERPFDPGLTVAGIPADAVTTSGSGVDPHISDANARIQARRVSEVRGIELERVLELIEEHTDGRALGVFGEPGVNVLELNLALDEEPGQREAA